MGGCRNREVKRHVEHTSQHLAARLQFLPPHAQNRTLYSPIDLSLLITKQRLLLDETHGPQSWRRKWSPSLLHKQPNNSRQQTRRKANERRYTPGRSGFADVRRLPGIQRHPVRACLRVARSPVHGTDPSRPRVYQHLHGQAGRLREALLPGVHAGRGVRQGDRVVRLLQVDRLVGDPAGRRGGRCCRSCSFARF